MVRTGRVEYDGHVVIVICVNMTVYVIISASVVITIIIIVVIIFSRDIFLIGFVFILIDVRDFKSQYAKDFQSNR